MTTLSLQHLVRLDELLAGGTVPRIALPRAIGETCVCDDIWRFFSDSWPDGGVLHWNCGSSWKSQWQPFLPPGLFSFGEDVFGNQLVLVDGYENVFLWDHESGGSHDLFLGPSDLLRTALESGIDWIEFYSNRSLMIARKFGAVPLDMHLDWTTPLILGGEIAPQNTALLERDSHLVGHAQIWSQVRDLPPGTAVMPK